MAKKTIDDLTGQWPPALLDLDGEQTSGEDLTVLPAEEIETPEQTLPKSPPRPKGYEQAMAAVNSHADLPKTPEDVIE